MKILAMAVLAVALWKPANAQMAAQITEAAAPQLEMSVGVKVDGTALVSLNKKGDKRTQTLESSVLRADGSLESETDSFYVSNAPAGSMTARFDMQSRLVEYSIVDSSGKTTASTRVSSPSSKTSRRIKYFSRPDNTAIVYFLNDFGRVTKKEIGRPQQNAQIVALYNERGVRREISVRQDDAVTRLALHYNDRNKLSQASLSGKEGRQTTYTYDQSGHPTEIKAVSGKDVVRTAMTYNAQGKPLETAVYKDENLQTRLSYSYDAQGRSSLFEIHAGGGYLVLQTTMTYDAAGKASSRTVAFSSDGTQTVVNTGAK